MLTALILWGHIRDIDAFSAKLLNGIVKGRYESVVIDRNRTRFVASLIAMTS